ncbi:conserved Plasmodium protein, unknown function [Plasmodium knowlesi strain H]|uniref:Uncharacterized protein n=3 Tax=Plasmodium knowlesi TaxID=5850 RepID=A0A5K1VKF4_PLAKH|nr:conserved Plasmodium protein, unknown function [Plasmodium knowlesi strain H]OTN66448.1 Uncharacterized protein PKNOH_S09548000 [Plasmodium knowlesi]CAA9989834.1 conserved Plasmodium protein, unknown function [Plasmodium knowlesi strain H]SBO24383.1 conserved Plasmodium protein, unknown function [Plasmodium knowlesi strain H]SBO26636.1 conserved Plasmodium protein, unknown function [Plasmodium knowlesi strain H]VVS79308.1 conserved Plasmodium protein, unknown function [Plasmodium knowlesi s|eukprot:XP_002259849.1 hypothetical protein, conserved in Plasmodium species [Plasmodium knowlesi strain H]
MTDKDATACDVAHFLKNFADLEKSYEHLLNRKKQNELRLTEALRSLEEIKEQYEQEKKKNFEMSIAIGEHTDRLIKKHSYAESYELLKRQNDDFKEKIESLRREKEQDKLLMEERTKSLEMKKQREVEEYDSKLRENKNKLLQLESQIVELDMDMVTKDEEIKKLSSLLKEIKKEHEIEKMEYEVKIKDLIKKKDESSRKKKEAIRDIINDSGSHALKNLKNKLHILQQKCNKMEKENANLKRTINKTEKKTNSTQDRTKIGSIKSLYKI